MRRAQLTQPARRGLSESRNAVPRVPSLDVTGDYISADSLNYHPLSGAFTLAPNVAPSDPQHHLLLAYDDFVAAGEPVCGLPIAGRARGEIRFTPPPLRDPWRCAAVHGQDKRTHLPK